MVWQFVGVYIINRTLHGRLEIRNFSSRVEKIFHSFAALTHEILFNTREEKFRISAQPCNILYLSFLYLGVKAQPYFVSLSDMFIDKKTLLKIWLNPGLNLNIFLGTGMGRQLPLQFYYSLGTSQPITAWIFGDEKNQG